MSLLAAHLLQSTAFGLAVALVVTAARGTSPRLRYALLLTALARFALPPIEVPWPVPAVEALLPHTFLNRSAADLSTTVVQSFDWTFTLAVVWITGIILSLCAWFVRSHRFRRSLEPLRPFEIGFPFPVYLSEGAASPLACGIFFRRIVLPAALVPRLSSSQLRAVLLHESIHLRHHDNLVASLSFLLRSVYWFHPLVWWLDAQALATREFARDEEVLSHLDPESYAEVLLQVCQSGLDLPGAHTAAMQSRNLQKRIDFSMQAKMTRQAPAARRAWIAFSLTAALISATVFYSQPVSAQQPRSRSDGSTPAANSPYDRWLAEDVTYIVTFQEKMRFNQIRTGAEREAFIEQFWLIRDPTPGTPENEMKTEHYRRIAYANERFGTASTPGWRTPRGRFYIAMGPPDQLEDHPQRQVQLWRYTTLAGVTLQFDLKQ